VDLGSKLVQGKEMRRGYTTGSCAAAAAKAAVVMLFSRQIIGTVTIMTPAGIMLELEVQDVHFSEEVVSCAIRKDAGDDPDITDGIRIYAQAKLGYQGIVIRGGQGIGVVTKPGLPVEVAEPAINPIPRKMILAEVGQVLPPDQGVEVTISIPGGEELARKTFNPRLGIVGGLSILGTTGIVEPMSAEAWQESIRLELKVLVAQGHRHVILVPGNYGEKFAQQELKLQSLPLVKMSNYVGYTIEACVNLGFTEVLLVGDLGKFIKVAAGIFNTHSHVADARMEISAAYAAALGASQATVKQILTMTTTGAVLGLLNSEQLGEAFCQEVARRVTERVSQLTHQELKVGTVIFANTQGLLAVDKEGQELIERYRK